MIVLPFRAQTILSKTYYVVVCAIVITLSTALSIVGSFSLLDTERSQSLCHILSQSLFIFDSTHGQCCTFQTFSLSTEASCKSFG